ncbi:MAG TPA: hypothetical protein VH934_16080 [Xanthobacteraceae bacterium]|jgi:hypothetical protein
MAARVYAASLCAAVIAAVAAIAVSPVEAQTTAKGKKRTYVYSQGRVAPANRPRARITVVPRSFLDAGTEVKPGDRKFTDYAFPPGYTGATGTVTNTGGKVGWDREPFMQPFQLPGFSPW